MTSGVGPADTVPRQIANRYTSITSRLKRRVNHETGSHVIDKPEVRDEYRKLLVRRRSLMFCAASDELCTFL